MLPVCFIAYFTAFRLAHKKTALLALGGSHSHSFT